MRSFQQGSGSFLSASQSRNTYKTFLFSPDQKRRTKQNKIKESGTASNKVTGTGSRLTASLQFIDYVTPFSFHVLEPKQIETSAALKKRPNKTPSSHEFQEGQCPSLIGFKVTPQFMVTLPLSFPALGAVPVNWSLSPHPTSASHITFSKIAASKCLITPSQRRHSS